MTLAAFNPGWLLILAGLMAFLMPLRPARQLISVLAPLAGIVLLMLADLNLDLVTAPLFGLELTLYRVDTLNLIFGLAFLIAALLHAIYTLHEDDRIHDAAALAFAGGAVSAVFAGDLLTFLVFVEIAAIASVALIFRSGTLAAYQAGMRYLGFQILSGLFLLLGIALARNDVAGVDFRVFDSLAEPGAIFLLAGLGIKAGFPLVHTWLQDAYSKATPGGAFLMSALTTKLAVYALARLFPGLDLLIWIGAVMTLFPVFFAVIENDLRKVLAFSTTNQIGFMVCAIGIGTPLALNGAVAHAFAHTFFKGLLFMSMGAVLYRTGTAKATELGGLSKSMPWTTLLCIIGALSISAVPLFSGFAAKSLTMSAVSSAGVTDPSLFIIWLALMFASAAVLEHSGLKIPYFAFFAKDSGKRVSEAPFNMLLAMGMAAVVCIAIGLPALIPGLSYKWLYSFLPYQAEAMAFEPFTPSHVIAQLQLLVLGAFAFALLKRFKAYPAEKDGVLADADWLWRRPGLAFVRWAGALWQNAAAALAGVSAAATRTLSREAEAAFSPSGRLASSGLSGLMALWAAGLLGLVLFMALNTPR